MLTKPQITSFQHKILSWYRINQRDLPWRKTRSPYHILISEVMSQQTQLSRVIPKYETWLQAFPTEQALANTPVREVLRLWSGLGYNRRALNLQKAVQMIVNDYEGVWPQTREELKKLPGVGDYTAGAVACFAFDEQIAVVDTNIRKVIGVEFFQGNPPDPKTLQKIADQLLPAGKAYEWNQALMDYAGAVLKKEKVPLIRQSKFVGSDRYYRGKIVKLLTEKGRVIRDTIGSEIKPDFSKEDEIWLERIIAGLLRDGLIRIEGEELVL